MTEARDAIEDFIAVLVHTNGLGWPVPRVEAPEALDDGQALFVRPAADTVQKALELGCRDELVLCLGMKCDVSHRSVERAFLMTFSAGMAGALPARASEPWIRVLAPV